MHGLFEMDSNLEDSLIETSLYQMPHTLMWFFVTILVYCNSTNVRELWEYFQQDMSKNFKPFQGVQTTIKMQVLWSFFSMLGSMEKDINAFHLIDHQISLDDRKFRFKRVNYELAIITPKKNILSLTILNVVQDHAYDSVSQKVFSSKSATFFVDRPNRIGKTFLYRVLIAIVILRLLVALETALSSVVASI